MTEEQLRHHKEIKGSLLALRITVFILGLSIIVLGYGTWRTGTIAKEWQLAIQKDIFTYCPSPKRDK